MVTKLSQREKVRSWLQSSKVVNIDRAVRFRLSSVHVAACRCVV